MSSTDDHGREDELRDPTAPAPEPADDTASEPPTGSAEFDGADAEAPGDAGTDPSWTASDTPYAGPSYSQPTSTQPIHEQPGHEQPVYGRPGHEQPAYGQPTYGQGTPYPSYGQPAGQGYGSQPFYGQGQPGVPTAPGNPSAGAPVPPPPGYPVPYQPDPYAAAPGYAPPRQNTSALVLTIVSGATILLCAGVLAIPALIFGIIGLSKQNQDPEASSRMSRYGWWAYAAGAVVAVIGAIIFFVVVFASATSSSVSYGY